MHLPREDPAPGSEDGAQLRHARQRAAPHRPYQASEARVPRGLLLRRPAHARRRGPGAGHPHWPPGQDPLARGHAAGPARGHERHDERRRQPGGKGRHEGLVVHVQPGGGEGAHGCLREGQHQAQQHPGREEGLGGGACADGEGDRRVRLARAEVLDGRASDAEADGDLRREAQDHEGAHAGLEGQVQAEGAREAHQLAVGRAE
mmetsp:Transcript_23074/g.52482  ORF Transcript_23074/g.52482 Transcript_23074/m.52482 type:complete len:204 (+) Transcript_23074:1070-1681(+)